MKTSRRKFITTTAAGLVSGLLLKDGNSRTGLSQKNRDTLKIGVTTYTFRKFDLEQAINMTVRAGLKKISLKNMHLALDSTREHIKAVAAQVRAAGLDLYGCGVVYMREKKHVSQAFEYAKTAGMRIIIGVPNHDLLNFVNDHVKKYNINFAIHNHGPGDKLYPSAESVYKKIENLDKRIGLCLDVGHSVRLGLDPLREVQNFSSRIFDIHIKDVSSNNEEGITVEMGRGIINIPDLLRILAKADYSGTLAIEYDKDSLDPLPGVAECAGYLRGALDTI